MTKVIKLTEDELNDIILKVINEQTMGPESAKKYLDDMNGKVRRGECMPNQMETRQIQLICKDGTKYWIKQTS